jgi:transposase
VNQLPFQNVLPSPQVTAPQATGFIAMREAAFDQLAAPSQPWVYDRELYKKRNQVVRLFRRLKGFRRIFSRFEKLDVVFLAFIYFAFIIEALR